MLLCGSYLESFLFMLFDSQASSSLYSSGRTFGITPELFRVILTLILLFKAKPSSLSADTCDLSTSGDLWTLSYLYPRRFGPILVRMGVGYSVPEAGFCVCLWTWLTWLASLKQYVGLVSLIRFLEGCLALGCMGKLWFPGKHREWRHV